MKGIQFIFLVFMVFGASGTLNTATVGKKVEDFKLKDAYGKEISLYQFSDKKGVVIMFIATRCPVSNAYNDRMALISKEYTGKGIQFLGINSNKQEETNEIAEHSKSHNFEFPVLKDNGNIIADRFDAQVTPEVYLIDPDKTIRYHGRIDDSQNEKNVKEKDLKNVLDAYLSGKPLPRTETKAFGCTIKRVNAS